MHHIKHIGAAVFSLLIVLSISSCKDTPEKLVDDLESLVEESNELLLEYEAGDISESELIEKMNENTVEAQEIGERMFQILEDQEVDAEKLSEDMMKALMPHRKKFEKIRERLKKAGKWSAELENTMGR